MYSGDDVNNTLDLSKQRERDVDNDFERFLRRADDHTQRTLSIFVASFFAQNSHRRQRPYRRRWYRTYEIRRLL